MSRTEARARSSAGSAEPERTLVLGLGNPLVSDDGFGPAVVQALRERGAAGPGVELCEASVAGFRLLDLMQGFARVLLIDVVKTGGQPAGTLYDWPLAAADRGRSLGGSHQCDLVTALRFGKALGLDLPRSILLLTAEAEDLWTVREALTPALAAAVGRAADCAAAWLERAPDARGLEEDRSTAEPGRPAENGWGTEEGRSDGEARILS